MRIDKSLGIVSLMGFMLAAQHSLAQDIDSYMVVTTLASGEGVAFSMSDSEIGAQGENISTSGPGSLPLLPGGTTRTVSDGITLDGDVAVTNGGTVSFSNSDVHAANIGPGSVGSQGVDCSASYAACTDGGSQILSSNRFNQTAVTANFSTLVENNGIQGGVDHSGLLASLSTSQGIISGATADGTRDLSGSGGQVSNESNAIWDYSGDGINGLTIIDIFTDSNDFLIGNSNLTILGDANDSLIFRLDAGAVMDISQSNLLLDGAIGDNNVLFFVDSDQGEDSFSFNDATFYGMSMWDLGTDLDNFASFNNVQFCGQVITDGVNFQNVSGSGCSFNTSAVPIPAAAWLFGSALLGLGAIKRKRR